MSRRQDSSVAHHSDDDVALSGRFARLRPARVLQAASFATTLAAARTRPQASHTSPRRNLMLAVAASVPFVVALVSQQRADAAARADVALVSEINALIQWRSPTASLLDPAITVQSWAMPTLRESIVSIPANLDRGSR